MTKDEISEALGSFDLPRWRCDQIYGWFRRGARAYEDMTNLPLPLRNRLADEFPLTPIAPCGQRRSSDGTAKYLWRIHGGDYIESVFMRYHHGASVCVSSQAGCKMGCKFCASAGAGFSRNLTASEMEEQALFSARLSETRASGIVLMGIGEPLDNFDNVIRFILLAGDPSGLGIGMRHISVSTCGGAPGAIDRLAGLGLGITLSISLHAPTDSLREKLMPSNRVCGLEAIMAQCKRYFESTGRRISYEYALIDGLNDSPEMADELARLLKIAPGHVNLIPLNAIPGSDLCPSSGNAVRQFSSRLASLGVNVTKRRRLGADIGAACGQLRISSKIPGGNI